MTLRELRYIVALADKQNFVRAAESCHVGQPTLSTQVRKLEEYLEVTLFERDNHHVNPTPVGEEVIERARIALEVVDEIRDLVRHAHDPMDGPFRLGAVATVAPYLLPPLMARLLPAYPQLRLSLVEDQTANLLEGLRAYRLDALLVVLPVRNGDVESLALFREPLVVALPAGHALAGRAEVAPEDLIHERLILLGEGDSLHEQALALWGGSQVGEGDTLEAGSIETLRQLVAAGVGCALLPALAATPEARSAASGLATRPLVESPPSRTIGMVWRRGYSRSATARTLARFIQANLPAGVEPVEAQGAADEGPAIRRVSEPTPHTHPARYRVRR